MAMLIDSKCKYVLLPRPWLEVDECLVDRGGEFEAEYADAAGKRYVSGRGLPYWHEVVELEIESLA